MTGRRSCTVALATAAAAAAALLLVSLPMLLVLPPDADTYEQETRQMFVEWKAKVKETYKYAGEEECRYANFKESRVRVAWARDDGVTSSGLNGLAARSIEEIYRGYRPLRKEEGLYEQETRRVFVGWKAEYGKTYRDVGEEECRYRLFKGNRRVVVRLNAAAAAAGQNAYGINQFGDLTKQEVRESCYPEMVDQELSARCEAIAPDPDPDHGRRIWYQVCPCIATEVESGGSTVPGDEAHKWI